MKKIWRIFLNAVPVLLMIVLIPLIQNDYVLAAVYAAIIAAAFLAKRGRHDTTVFVFGFFAMIVFEYLFVSTGVETFNRNSLLGLMPIWLPFLWGYGFVAIRRAVEILDK
ncbi:MAG: hypothetical protein KGJ13_06190 [Patescibacteria group bacterium]|nr:hypothetical protein [Patescibacteria group bacterium]